MNRQEIFRNMLKKDETMRIGVYTVPNDVDTLRKRDCKKVIIARWNNMNLLELKL